MWKVEVTSKESITPLSPTLPHLRTHNLSWIDRLLPPYHLPCILFYPNPNPDYVSILKTSLSRTLSIFYPVAGELDSDQALVHCNDRGALLIEAIAISDFSLSELIDRGLIYNQNLSTLQPYGNEDCRGNSGNPLLTVQITTFSSGGIAVSACIWHKIADAHSLSSFIAAWAASAAAHEGDSPSLSVLPAFDAASIYPHISSTQQISQNEDSVLDQQATNPVTKIFTLDEASVSRLRKSSSITNLSRVQAVIALLWRCCMRARGIDRRSKPSTAIIPVNMRYKAKPPLPDNLFGNLLTHAVPAMTEAEANSKSKSEEKVSSAIKNMDGEWLREYKEADGWPLRKERAREIKQEIGDDWDSYIFTSWTSLSFYEADFGWGKPKWMGIGGSAKNNVILMGGRRGAIEAWVMLEEEEMARFERDEEILAYASSSSSSSVSSVI